MYGPDRAVPVLCSQNVATTGEMVIHEGHNNTDHGDDDDYHIDIEMIIPTLMGVKSCWERYALVHSHCTMDHFSPIRQYLAVAFPRFHWEPGTYNTPSRFAIIWIICI